MFHHRPRHIAAAPAGPLRAQAQIGVLAVQEETFVEQPDLFEHRAPVQRRGAARQESLVRVCQMRSETACLLDPSEAINMPAESSFSVPASRTSEANIPMRWPMRMRFGVRQQFLQPARIGDGVVIERRQVRSTGRAKSLVHGGAEAHVAIVRDHANTRAGSLHAPGSAVVDHHHLELVHSLRFQRPQARLQHLAGGQCRHGYGNLRGRQEMILTYNHEWIRLFRRFHRAIVRQIPRVEKTVRLNVAHGRKQRFFQTRMLFFQLAQNIA